MNIPAEMMQTAMAEVRAARGEASPPAAPAPPVAPPTEKSPTEKPAAKVVDVTPAASVAQAAPPAATTEQAPASAVDAALSPATEPDDIAKMLDGIGSLDEPPAKPAYTPDPELAQEWEAALLEAEGDPDKARFNFVKQAREYQAQVAALRAEMEGIGEGIQSTIPEVSQEERQDIKDYFFRVEIDRYVSANLASEQAAVLKAWKDNPAYDGYDDAVLANSARAHAVERLQKMGAAQSARLAEIATEKHAAERSATKASIRSRYEQAVTTQRAKAAAAEDEAAKRAETRIRRAAPELAENAVARHFAFSHMRDNPNAKDGEIREAARRGTSAAIQSALSVPAISQDPAIRALAWKVVRDDSENLKKLQDVLLARAGQKAQATATQPPPAVSADRAASPPPARTTGTTRFANSDFLGNPAVQDALRVAVDEMRALRQA